MIIQDKPWELDGQQFKTTDSNGRKLSAPMMLKRMLGPLLDYKKVSLAVVLDSSLLRMSTRHLVLLLLLMVGLVLT